MKKIYLNPVASNCQAKNYLVESIEACHALLPENKKFASTKTISITCKEPPNFLAPRDKTYYYFVETE